MKEAEGEVQTSVPTEKENGFPEVRLDRLNTIRAVAITIVVVYHACTAVFGVSAEKLELDEQEWDGSIRALVTAGFRVLSSANHLIGIFFLMSGYTLHRVFRRWRERNLDRNGQSFARFFIWHRFWRLVPAFWVALLISYFLAYEHPFSLSALRKLAVNASLLKTLYPGYFFSVNYAHWYVAVQWQLDLLYPVFLFVAWRRSFALAAGIACALALTVTFVVPLFSSEAYFLYLPFRWWTEWTLGALLAEMHARNRRLFPRPWLVGGVVLLAVLIGWRQPFVHWLIPRVGLALAFEVLVLSKSSFKSWERWVAPVGICSYALYLLHIPVFSQIIRLCTHYGVAISDPKIWLPVVIVSWGLSFGISWCFYRLVEEKSVAYGNRLWRRRKSWRLFKKPGVAAA